MRKLAILSLIFAFAGCASVPSKKSESTVSLAEYKMLKKYVGTLSQELAKQATERTRFQEKVAADFLKRDRKQEQFIGWFGILMSSISQNFKRLYQNQATLSAEIKNLHSSKADKKKKRNKKTPAKF